MIQLSHIGETLLSAILNESDEAQSIVFGSAQNNGVLFKPEIRLEGLGGFIFDGAHKVDVCAINKDRQNCIAIEAKLGFDRLSKNEFSRRFLRPCGKSHKATRLTGSMIAILDNLLPTEIPRADLSVKLSGDNYKLEMQWVLIVRKKVIDNWRINGSPTLSSNCKVIAFEDLVDAYGGKQVFNDLVERLLIKDYYKNWIQIIK